MYLLEGNIGVGKSTFLNIIQRLCPEITIAQEPLESWATQAYGQSLLENFYKEPKRWAYTIETLAMFARMKDHLKEQRKKRPRLLMERSIYSGHYCFAYNDKEQGFLSDIEWAMYLHWAQSCLQEKCASPKGFIYLKANPETCFERVKKRDRPSEKDLTLDYLKQIHEKHESFLIEKKNIFDDLKKVPVLVLDCNQDFASDDRVMSSFIQEIFDFIGIDKVAI